MMLPFPKNMVMVWRNAAVAVVYLLTAKLGFLLAMEHTNATVLWPPSGIALAVFLIFGFRIWPGIFLGAFLANMMIVTGEPFSWGAALSVSAATAVGNTLEAVLGGSLVRRVTGTSQPFDRPWDSIKFILLATLVSPVLSATIGASSFCLYSANWSRWMSIWVTWWLGDAVGMMVFAPLLLCWKKRRHFVWNMPKIFEAVILLIFFAFVELILFKAHIRLEYLVFPVLFWTAFRFGQFESAITVAFVMLTFLFWTSKGLGPFNLDRNEYELLFLQSYIWVASASTLLLATLVNSRRNAEDRLRKYRNNLENLVQARTAELQKTNNRLILEIEDRSRAERELALARDRAELADQAKSAFLANMSHELRTPLNSIIGFTGILLQRLGGPLTGEQEKQLQMVRNSSNHLLLLISDVLDISKIEAGQLTVAVDPFDLKESVLKVMQTVRPLAEKKGLELSLDVAPDVAVVIGDMRRVEQILLNLLSNAVKFTEKGGIHVACHMEDESCITTVSDTGIGIRQEDIPSLFKPFLQVDTGLNRKYEGTGLGLSICKRLAELMGGEVGVRSNFGAGSAFWFTLPVKSEIQNVQPQSVDVVPVLGLSHSDLNASSVTQSLETDISILIALLKEDDLLAVEQFELQGTALKMALGDNFQIVEAAIRRFDYATAGILLEQSLGQGLRPELTTGQPFAKLRQTVLVVDDVPNNVTLLGTILKEHYHVKVATSGDQALRIARTVPLPDLILLDIMMPGMDGYEVCRQLKSDTLTSAIPVVFLTARIEVEDEKHGLELGAVDYITKPFIPSIVSVRVKNQLALKGVADFLRDKNQYLEQEVFRRTEELRAIQEVTILALASLAETRDNATGNHLRRTQQYVRLLALQLKGHPRFAKYLDEREVSMLFRSAPLHDIGKVGVPDRILLKPGKLDPDEFEIMKSHTVIGAEAIEQAEHSLGTGLEYLRIAKDIIRHHQEKWDGSGYPDGLSGEAISVYSRLMAVADVYDALISHRVYREGLPHEQVVEIIQSGSGSHFDPDVVVAFMQLKDQFNEIALQFADSAPI